MNWDTSQLQALVLDWGPRIVGAVLVLIAAHFLAKAAQWALAKLVDRLPGANYSSQPEPRKSTGYQLGQLGYWLVLLLGVIAALTILGLTTVVTPLNQLLTNVLGFVPNIIGAALIFFVGLVVATLARRIVETALNVAHVDRALQRSGLSQMTGATGLAKGVGTLVFVLILIPVAIAALQQLNIRAISDPAVAVLSTVLNAIPHVLAAAIVLGIAYFIARWVAGILEQILPSLGVDRSLQALGVGQPTTTPPDLAVTPPGEAGPAAATWMTPSKVLARVAFIAIMLFSAVEAARLLAFGAIAVMLAQILELAAHVLFGGVIILAGVLLANFLAGLARRATGAEGIASNLVRWSTIALASAMGLRFMGIADEIVIIAFALILGAAAVAAALAFGIGGRETARRLLDEWSQRAQTRQQTRTRSEPPRPRVQ